MKIREHVCWVIVIPQSLGITQFKSIQSLMKGLLPSFARISGTYIIHILTVPHVRHHMAKGSTVAWYAGRLPTAEPTVIRM